VLVTAATWVVAYGRTTRLAWSTPISYEGDALFLLAYLKAAADGHVLPGASLLVPELNAPFGANWNDHPRTLRPVFLFGGLLVRPLGLFATLNLILLAAHVLASLTFFTVARHLRARREWAFAGALAFGLSHFMFWRSIDHLDLALGWHIPLAVLVLSWAFSRRGIPLRSRRLPAAAGVAALAAVHNPYYAAMFAQFLVLAAIAQLVRRPRGPTLAPLALVVVLAVVFLADHAGSLAFQWEHGRNPGASRPYGNLERYSLKPLELLVPPPGFGLGDWGHLARVHWQQRLYRGEGGSPYLGLVGAAGLAGLAALSIVRVLRRPSRVPPPAALAVLWVLGFSMLGGLNQLLGVFGFLWLRGTNRYSVWILALVLLYLATRRVRPRWLSQAGAGVACVVCVSDQVPMRADRGALVGLRTRVESDRAFVAGLQARLPREAMLFNLPVIEFPEGRPLPGVGEYEQLRPYLHSRGLRWSFGSDKGRPREAWRAAVVAQGTATMVSSLEACGFAGLLVDRRAYPPGADDILEELAALGRPVAASSASRDFAFVPLHPEIAPPPPRPEDGLHSGATPGAWGGQRCAAALAASPSP
jgi:hypothetical protein